MVKPIGSTLHKQVRNGMSQIKNTQKPVINTYEFYLGFIPHKRPGITSNPIVQSKVEHFINQII